MCIGGTGPITIWISEHVQNSDLIFWPAGPSYRNHFEINRRNTLSALNAISYHHFQICISWLSSKSENVSVKYQEIFFLITTTCIQLGK